jgi:hypothetical protein
MRALVLTGMTAFLLAASQGAADAQQLSRFCENQYNRYMDSQSPRAFVTASDGSCWWGYGQRSERASIEFAMNACRRNNRPNCRIYSSSR